MDDGLLAWDTPAREYLPEFRVGEPGVSDTVTVRDLLAHRTGLPRHEFAWLSNPSLPRDELVRRIRHLPMSAGLRERWQYSNLAYATAGQIAGIVTGSTWEAEMRRRVFEPLGMSRTVTTLDEATSDDDVATPFGMRDDEVVELDHRRLDNVAPAGQVFSCATDIARWLLCHTGGGEIDGRRIISEAALRETHTLQTSMGNLLDSPELPHVKYYGYCLGWLVGTYRGREWLWHNGGIDGFRTELALVPGERLGVALSGNLHNSQLPFWLLHHVLDRMLSLDARPWTDEAMERSEKAKPDEPQPTASTKPAHALQDYAAEYAHPGYGTLGVTADGEELRFRLGELELDASYRHYETWDVRYAPLEAPWTVTFSTDPDGAVAEAAVPFEPTVEPIRFKRA